MYNDQMDELLVGKLVIFSHIFSPNSTFVVTDQIRVSVLDTQNNWRTHKKAAQHT